MINRSQTRVSAAQQIANLCYSSKHQWKEKKERKKEKKKERKKEYFVNPSREIKFMQERILRMCRH